MADQIPEEPPELRALIVDDRIDAAVSMSYLLQHIGVRTAVAFGAEMGWRLVELFHPGLVLVNLEMPDIDGLEFARRAQAAAGAADVPARLFVALSEVAVADVEQACREAGFARVVRQPMPPEVLGEVIACARALVAASVPAAPAAPAARRSG